MGFGGFGGFGGFLSVEAFGGGDEEAEGGDDGFHLESFEAGVDEAFLGGADDELADFFIGGVMEFGDAGDIFAVEDGF